MRSSELRVEAEYDVEGAAVRVEAGRLKIASLHREGYGYALEPRVEARTPLDAWRFEEAAR